MNKIKSWLQTIFNCNVVGHEWLIDPEKNGRYIYLNRVNFRCRFCPAKAADVNAVDACIPYVIVETFDLSGQPVVGYGTGQLSGR